MADLVVADARERDDEQGGRRSVLASGELVLAAGEDALAIRASDLIEIDSKASGTGTWRVTGQPKQAGHGRPAAVIVSVERTFDPVRESVFAP